MLDGMDLAIDPTADGILPSQYFVLNAMFRVKLSSEVVGSVVGAGGAGSEMLEAFLSLLFVCVCLLVC